MFMFLKFLFLTPYLAFAEEKAEKMAGPQGLDFISSVLEASIIVQITFLILVIMSIVSWAIILQKYFFFKQMEEEKELMQDVFLKDGSLEQIYSKSQNHPHNPWARIFISGFDEMKKIMVSQKDAEDSESKTEFPHLDNVERALRKTCENELAHMESGLSFLATAGSSGPFIGLFGTVFGIMNSFNKIAVMGSASLNVVAPGIAEALLATAVGLFAAIPASIFYNKYLSSLRHFSLGFNNFTTDFLNVGKRNFVKENG